MNVHTMFVKLSALKNVRTSGASLVGNCRNFHGPMKTEEYTPTPEFPKVEHYRNSDEKEYDSLKNFMKSLKTVEEKQIYLNKPKYYGWYSTVLNPNQVLPDSLELFQFATNTTLVDDLPAKLKSLQELAAKEAEILEPAVKKHLLLQSQTELTVDAPQDKAKYYDILPGNEDTFAYVERKTDHHLASLNRLLHIHLAQRHPHLLNQSIDREQRIEAFWMRSGFQPDRRMVSKRKSLQKYAKKRNFTNQLSDDEVWKHYDNCFQITGQHSVSMRSNATFDPYVDIEDPICQSGSVPEYNYSTKVSGYPSFNRHATNVPGHWTGSENQFINLSWINSVNRSQSISTQTAWDPESGFDFREEMLTCKAILASYGVLLPTACYLGFDPMNDPTRPLATNVVISDGQKFKFASYQLNKTELVDAAADVKDSIEKFPRNVMWHLPEQRLYEAIDVKSGHVEGFNRDVLANLITFYILRPSIKAEDVDNSQYLDLGGKYLHTLRNTYNRNYTFRIHRHISSNRPRHYAKPDIEFWEKIHHLRHPENAFMFGFREMNWFKMAKYDSLGKFHWHPEFRSLDYYIPAYQPSKFRPEGKKKYQGYSRVRPVFPPVPRDEN